MRVDLVQRVALGEHDDANVFVERGAVEGSIEFVGHRFVLRVPCFRPGQNDSRDRFGGFLVAKGFERVGHGFSDDLFQ